MAERTGLEPATPCVTGRYSNQLNYRSAAINMTGLKPATTIPWESDSQTSDNELSLCSDKICLVVGVERLELPTFAL